VKPRTILSGALLAFVALTVIWLVAAEVAGRKPAPPTAQDESTGTASRPSDTSAPAETPKADQADARKVVAYYFHGNMRCMTCRAIEANARQAIETGFPDALKDGRLQWRVINVEEPRNEHYVTDFKLTTRSVVLQETVGGKQTRWKNLDRVWELIRDKDAFLPYVRKETRDYLGASE